MIGIFDSGIGGLSVLREIRKLLPDHRYVYYADSAHCPYGEKTAGYVRDRARAITEFLIGKGADIIVVACNTATAAAIETLRKEYSDHCSEEVRARVRRLSGGRRDYVDFIGMEPAVKPASGMTKSGVVGVLATSGTLNGDKYRSTRKMFSEKVTVVEHVGAGFVEAVEKGITRGEEAERIVKESLTPLLRSGADTIVLGCTHYPFLYETIKKVAGEGVNVIDPAPAVARHLVDIMREEHIPLKENVSGAIREDIRLYSSGDTKLLEKFLDEII